MPSDEGNNNGDESQAVSQAEAALKARLGRKRTKTGCLTCRKRRIKCGEERPICRNCVKSRRHCEGYTQRVLFRPQNFEHATMADGAQITFSAAPTPYLGMSPAVSDADFSSLHPRPMRSMYPPPDQAFAMSPPNLMQPTYQFVHRDVPHPQPQVHTALPTAAVDGIAFTFNGAPTHVYRDSVLGGNLDPLALSGSSTPGTGSLTELPMQKHPTHSSQSSWSSSVYASRLDGNVNHFQHIHGASPRSEARSATSSVPEDLLQFARSMPSQLLDEAAVEVQDDDYYDVDNDESSCTEADVVPMARDMQARLHIGTNGSRIDHQSYAHLWTGAAQHGMLDRYRVENVASPLRNPATVQVFMHFIGFTGPNVSPFERNAALRNVGDSLPLSQQGLWTYTMPRLALKNHGLLHAILALSSLHMSNLQGTSATPSLQHYAWSLKRVHSAVVKRQKRLDVGTIAASMLLGFYELASSDQNKWNTHLAGARQLFQEIDFATKVRQFREMKVQRQVRLHQRARSGAAAVPDSAEDLALDDLLDVDEPLISRLVGHDVRYGQQEFVDYAEVPPPLDLSRLTVLSDLFFWYCKQDAYQSLISGDPLLMDYKRWTACPPRAPMSVPDRVYGTFDHLTLLLGRVAAFCAKDKERKLDEMRRNGGQWAPHPASRMAQMRPSRPMPRPEFFGMTPAPRTVEMPAPYKSLDEASSPASDHGIWSIEAALEEYNQIQEALRLFKASLGPAFQVCQEGLPSPFGSALVYASCDIACLWSIYNAIVIVALRSHPFYHPAAHVAAAMAVADTAFYANEIGRISAGISPGPPSMLLDPLLSSVLAENCMPLFFAAIQYTCPEQRHFTIRHIDGIAQKIGWAPASLIANGCETAWVKAAQAGRGPPYERLLRSGPVLSTDARLTGEHGNLENHQQPDPDDDIDRRFVRQKASARLHWAIGLIGTENDI